MRRLLEVFSLQLRALVRGRVAFMLLAFAVVWMLALPHFLRSDGTEDGVRELYVRYGLGGVFVVLVVSLAAAGAGALSKDRAAKRLQLSLVRPIRAWMLAAGRTAALAALGAVVLAVACGFVALRCPLNHPCDHVLSPVMESPRAEAERMYGLYMADPSTPAEVRKVDRAVVLRILTQKAEDHYQTVGTNEIARWRFPSVAAEAELAVRLRFTNLYDTREDVNGVFRFADASGVVSNVTRAVVRIPLVRGSSPSAGEELSYANGPASSVMLRTRKDIKLLIRADGFGWNLLRAYWVMFALLVLAVSFAVFLGSFLGRSVAVFTVMASLLVAEVAPSIVYQYPDALEKNRVDRIGLTMLRGINRVVSPLSGVDPLASLAADDCVELPDVLRTLAVDGLLMPLLLALAAGAMMRKSLQS